MSLIRGSHFASLGSVVTFFTAKSEMGITIPAKTADVDLQCDSWTAFFCERSYWPLVFLVALSVKLCVAAITSLLRLELPGRDRTPCLGVTALPSFCGATRKSAFVCPFVLCFLLSNLPGIEQLIEKLSPIFPNRTKSEEIRQKTTLNLCMHFFCIYVFLDGCVPPHVQGIKI